MEVRVHSVYSYERHRYGNEWYYRSSNVFFSHYCTGSSLIVLLAGENGERGNVSHHRPYFNHVLNVWILYMHMDRLHKGNPR